MADEPASRTPPSTPTETPPAPTEIPTVRIAPEVPVIFCDAIKSHAFGVGMTKFYFYRTDPDPDVVGQPREVITAQMIMPSVNFVRMVAFLEHRVKLMIESGDTTKEEFEVSRKYWVDNPSSGTRHG